MTEEERADAAFLAPPMIPLSTQSVKLFACPRCGEQPGQPCRALSGRRKTGLPAHGERMGLLKEYRAPVVPVPVPLTVWGWARIDCDESPDPGEELPGFAWRTIEGAKADAEKELRREAAEDIAAGDFVVPEWNMQGDRHVLVGPGDALFIHVYPINIELEINV